MSGLQLQSRLVALGYAIPIIVITAFPSDRVREPALSAGAMCFLDKPFNKEDLLTGIRSALDRRHDDCPRRDRHESRAFVGNALAPLHDGFGLVSTARGSTSHEHSEPNGHPLPPQTGFATGIGIGITQSECDIMAICKLQSALLKYEQKWEVANRERN